MTASRKGTLSVKEFSQLVSESLDIDSPTSGTSQSFIHQLPVVSEDIDKPKPSPFQRIFARPPAPQQDPAAISAEQIPESPRKMGFGWPFSRSSPQKRRSPTSGLSDADIGESPAHLRQSKSTDALKSYRSAASAAGSTSSLGSLVPVHERMFNDVARESFFSEAGPAVISSPTAAAQSQRSSSFALVIPLLHSTHHSIFGNRSTVSLVSGVDRAAGEHGIDLLRDSSLVNAARESVDTSSTLATSEPDFSDDDPTPRATTFGARAAIAGAVSQHRVTLAQRRRPQNLSLVLPIKNCDTLSLRPAVGATPHPPSDTDGSVSASSIPSPTSPLPHQPSVASMSIRSRASVISSRQRIPSPSPSKSSAPAAPSDLTRSANSASMSSVNGFPGSRARAGSRSTKSPPLPGPPPCGPLPAVPVSLTDPVPPVPPLPSLLKKKSITLPSQLTTSPSRPALSSSTMSVATPPSPPGNLRLPSRLSWIGAGRAVVAPSSTLPSPPASPTKTPKAHLTPPSTPSRTHKSSGNLKRPTSIGILEAADNAVVRRTKSILLLGSRSKSNGSLGVSSNSPPKRVQIHADANADASSPTRKPRRKSSAVPTGFSSSGHIGVTGDEPVGPQLLVPRERRHSAPLLRGTSADGEADWTLSLPFSIDVPGEKIAPPSPPLPTMLPPSQSLPQPEAEAGGEDWTLCMPLKVRVEQASTTTAGSEESVSECTQAHTSETCCTTQTQLPTPSPSPTPSTPLRSTRALAITRRSSNETLGPHAGGLDMDGGCGKRGSGWDVSGWFGPDVVIQKDYHQISTSANSDFVVRRGRSDEMKVPLRSYEALVRNPSQDSTNTTSTLETVFYSARSSLLSA
ncbi:hypothetical protein F5I97DRAFT_1831618 [Phlebopus sp. FC_14]|nr:hypothetical protein F5I97DRAFT_1831618 [Phlebopus sp. FC_14]